MKTVGVTDYRNKYVYLTIHGVTKSGTIRERFGLDQFYFNELILTNGRGKEIFITRYYESFMTDELRAKAIKEFNIRERIYLK
jgi:hypothetical protein